MCVSHNDGVRSGAKSIRVRIKNDHESIRALSNQADSLRRSSRLRSLGSSSLLRRRIDFGVDLDELRRPRYRRAAFSSVHLDRAGLRRTASSLAVGADVGELLALEHVDLEVVAAGCARRRSCRDRTFQPGSTIIGPRSLEIPQRVGDRPRRRPVEISTPLRRPWIVPLCSE